LKTRSAKIQEQSPALFRCAQVPSDLTILDLSHQWNRLELDDDLVEADKVDAVTNRQQFAFVMERQSNLTHKRNSSPLQLDIERFTVHGLRESVPKYAVHFECRTDDLERLRIIECGSVGGRSHTVDRCTRCTRRDDGDWPMISISRPYKERTFCESCGAREGKKLGTLQTT